MTLNIVFNPSDRLWWVGVQLCWWVKFKFNCIVERSGGKQSKEHSTLVRPWLWWWPLWSTVLTFQHWAVPCPLLHTAPQPINQNYFRQNSAQFWCLRVTWWRLIVDWPMLTDSDQNIDSPHPGCHHNTHWKSKQNKLTSTTCLWSPELTFLK